MNVGRLIPAPGTKPDRSKERSERCEAIVRRLFPSATEVKIMFWGPLADPLAEVWHETDGIRRCKVFRVNEGDHAEG